MYAQNPPDNLIKLDSRYVLKSLFSYIDITHRIVALYGPCFRRFLRHIHPLCI